MALNRYMHPRNRYKKEKPSFLQLAIKYPDFRTHVTQNDSGKVFLDFKNSDALRALTTCLLKEDFGLNVELPSNRLIPTLPLRLNYIHWIEDIVGTKDGLWGIDIGTGACSIYPLLATKMNKWNFLATEADPENHFHAGKNINANNLQTSIKLKKTETSDIIKVPLEELGDVFPSQFDFCMCNPPFFADHMEAQAIESTRSLERADPNSVSTASPEECIASGGEVGFVRQMIEESVLLQDKIRVYTSMVGKKTSLGKLKEDLKHHKISNYSTTDFCQGKTMRWGIAWTFDNSIKFPRSEFESKKKKAPLIWNIPQTSGICNYDVHSISAFLKDLLQSMQVHIFQGKKAKSFTSLTLTAAENTWSHQRRRRREQQRLQQLLKSDSKEFSTNPETEKTKPQSTEPTVTNMKVDGDTENTSIITNEDQTSKRNLDVSDHDDDKTPCKKIKIIENDNSVEVSNQNKASTGTSEEDTSKDEKNTEVESEINDMSPKDFILKCVMRLKRITVEGNDEVQMELEFLEGDSKELMHQLYTFLKNKLTVCSTNKK